MSQPLISRSPDLQLLQNEGYDLEIRSDHLLLHRIPYVTPERQVAYGTLVTALTLQAERTTRPADHVVYFIGQAPCDHHGQLLSQVINSSIRQTRAPGIEVDHMFSAKPAGGYANYHDKMTSYATMLTSQARFLDPAVTATPFPVIPVSDEEADSPFHYRDTASARAGIAAVTTKLAGHRVAIVGLGGTGSYLLDFLAKTPVGEIHLYDADQFLQHNAFRAPGAATLQELDSGPSKVGDHHQRYSAMHRGIITHPYALDAGTAAELQDMDFVFLALDDSRAKAALIPALEQYGVPFIDAGMGLNLVGDAIAGMVRVTTSTPDHRTHVHTHHRIPLAGAEVPDEYGQNIQVAELNALNAALAVVKWKKYLGFYQDLDHEHHSVYTLDGNHLLNEDTFEDQPA